MSPRSSFMFAGISILLAASVRTVSCLPTPAPVSNPGFMQGVPSDIVWPSYVAHLSQAQPDSAFGPKQNAFVYRIPGESKDIGTQMAFTMPDDDDKYEDDGYKKSGDGDYPGSFCMLGFLDMNKLWGTADWASEVTESQDFTIFAYLEAAVLLRPNDTWNQHPVVDYDNTIAKVQVNSTGIYIDAAEIACQFEDNLAQFWLQAVGNQSCDLSWAEGMEPLSGLVIQKYVMS